MTLRRLQAAISNATINTRHIAAHSKLTQFRETTPLLSHGHKSPLAAEGCLTSLFQCLTLFHKLVSHNAASLDGALIQTQLGGPKQGDTNTTLPAWEKQAPKGLQFLSHSSENLVQPTSRCPKGSLLTTVRMVRGRDRPSLCS